MVSEGPGRFQNIPLRVRGTVGPVLLTCESTSEGPGHILSQERTDSHEAGADYGRVIFQERPNHNIATVPCQVVSVKCQLEWKRHEYIHVASRERIW